MSIDIPPRQKEVLTLIAQLTEQRGFPPTLAELAKAMGLKNRMTVHQHVVALKKKGLVLWEPGLNRSLRLTGDAPEEILAGLGVEAADPEVGGRPNLVALDGTAAGGNTVGGAGSNAGVGPAGKSKIEAARAALAKASGSVQPMVADDYDERAAKGIPLAGTIAAGSPIDAYQTSEYLEVDSQYRDNGCFALKIKGDSMIEDGIFDGDFVICQPQPSPRNGEIVVATLDDGTATLKRFFKENGRYRLQPANASMEPIFVDASNALEIQGVVVALFRKMH